MSRHRKDGLHTRQRLLEAACLVFARRGFRSATLAEICRMARANIAAANYHFGGKMQLYVEAWRFALGRSLAAHPPEGEVRADAPARERLHARIRSIMRRISDPASCDFDIVQKEMANPTGHLQAALHGALAPIRRRFEALIRELLGGRPSAKAVRLCHMSIMSQCFGPVIRERRRRVHGSIGLPPRRAPAWNVDDLADHVTRFSLAGIEAVRRHSISRSGRLRALARAARVPKHRTGVEA